MLDTLETFIEILDANEIFSSEGLTIAKRESIQKAGRKSRLDFFPYYTSLQVIGKNIFLLVDHQDTKKLLRISPRNAGQHVFSVGETTILPNYEIEICPLCHENADRLRNVFDFSAPKPIGLKSSFGTGDRMGGIASATPAHIRASEDYDISIVLAQQADRENRRTGRNFAEVLDDVTWSVFQEGYKRNFGADADHLPNLQSVEEALDVGYTMFTIDPFCHINQNVHAMSKDSLNNACSALLGSKRNRDEFIQRYLSIDREIGGGNNKVRIAYTRDEIVRIAVKFLRTIRFVYDAYKLIESRRIAGDFDFEVSIDETDTPTTALEHYMIVNELKRSGVKLTSVAPRFAAAFEKGVDIRAENGEKPSLSDLKKFEKSVIAHTLVSKAMGPYKLSIHSGSDKFTAYPILRKHLSEMFHVKTSGTSFIETVKVIARHDFELYKKIHEYALNNFTANRQIYDLRTDFDNVPKLEELNEEMVVNGLEINDDWRQVIHVSASVLRTYRKAMTEVLMTNKVEYYNTVANHIRRHLELLGLRRVGLKQAIDR
jgi:hypothetical protein